MSPSKGLWEIESGLIGKGYGMVCPLAELVGTPVRDCENGIQVSIEKTSNII